MIERKEADKLMLGDYRRKKERSEMKQYVASDSSARYVADDK